MTKQTKKKKENRRKRKILLALLLIVFTGVILTASTYAWFTSNKTVTVDSIDVQVQAANGIQISTDATNWKATVTNTDLNNTLQASSAYSNNTNQLPFKSADKSVRPVSTNGIADSGRLPMYLGTLGNDASGNTTLTTVQSVESKGNTGDFVVFDLFFQVTSNSVVKLGTGSDVKTASTGTNKGLKNAARVAFLNLGHTDLGAAPATAQALSSGTEVKIWEPNTNVHTAAAVNDALSTYGLSITQSQVLPNYYGVAKEISTGVSLKNQTDSNIGSNFTKVTPAITSVGDGLTADADWFTLQAGITKIRFYLWIEGQDVDCENTASGDSITYTMNFVLAE